MATMDNYPISAHFDYASTTKLKEEMDKQYPLSRAFSIPSETQILNFNPEIPATDALVGIARTCQTPFASILPPPNYYMQHNKTFSYEIIPSLKEFIKFTKQQSTHFTLTTTSTPYESGESQNNINRPSPSPFYSSLVQQAVFKATQVVQQLNKNLDFVRNNMARFLQG